mmetsp:Transcript_21510/g.68718  ORF Transcript_21510/g.68718 Transcript_21510/m.68718 type:complete len:390 (+) Transcript_21510:34-1203(+)
MSGLEKVIEEKLGRWRQQGEAAEYYALRNRGPYKPTVSHELNRFGGQMGPYVDALLDLQTVEYINASPIDNLGEEAPAFIATMCPKRSTFEHFWMMVWETGARVIVNLTHERDKVGSAPADKRERYWPPFDEAMERESRGWAVQVRTLGHESCESVAGLLRYAVELRGSASGGPPPSCGERTRVVVLYWYSRWLDFPASSSIGTRPFYANAENVLHLAVHLQQLLARGEPHWCVCHCSAGVGRTGTLIALLRVLQRLPALQSEAQLDSFVRTTIERMRERRLWMVKTDVEYALLYAATLLWLRRSRDKEFELSWQGDGGDDWGATALAISEALGPAASHLQEVRESGRKRGSSATGPHEGSGEESGGDNAIDNARDVQRYRDASLPAPP